MALVARVAIGLSVVLGTASCASVQVQLDPAERERLRRGPPIHVVHVEPLSLLFIHHPAWMEVVPAVNDPAAEVARAFLDAARADPGLANLAPSDRPVERRTRPVRGQVAQRPVNEAPPISDLPEQWVRDGHLLEIQTDAWELDASGLKKVTGGCTLLLSARARLLRLIGGTVVWRQFCRVEHSAPCAELVAGDYDRVKQLRAELARRCGTELSRSLAAR